MTTAAALTLKYLPRLYGCLDSQTLIKTHTCFLSSFLSIKIKKKIQLLTLQPGNWKHPFALPALLASVQLEEWQSWNRHKTRNLNTDEAIIVHSVADDHPQHSHWCSCIFSSLQYSYKNNSVKLYFPLVCCSFVRVPPLNAWGSPNTGWEGCVCNVFPHLCIVSYIQVQCSTPLWQLHSKFRDFKSGVCRVMKISVAESNPDRTLNTPISLL